MDTKSSEPAMINSARRNLINTEKKTKTKDKASKGNKLKKNFSIPQAEELLWDVAMNLRKKEGHLNARGKLYGFTHYLCYSSSLFGIKSNEVIPVEDILTITKNTDWTDFIITVETKSSKFVFFCPMSAGKENYKKIHDLWGNTVGVQEELPDSDTDEDVVKVERDPIDKNYLTGEFKDNGFLVSSKDNSWTELVKTEFNVDVVQFFKLFYSDGDFHTVYHNRRGDKELVIGPWKEQPQYGICRELKYRVQVRAAIGPSSTIVNEVQRYHMQEEKLLVETSVSMQDIPYADYFHVEGLWDVSLLGPNSCQLIIKVGIPFNKKTWLKGTIESNTIKETKESYEAWVTYAHETINSVQAGDSTKKKGLPTKSISTPPLGTSNSPSLVSPGRSVVSSIGPSRSFGSNEGFPYLQIGQLFFLLLLVYYLRSISSELAAMNAR